MRASGFAFINTTVVYCSRKKKTNRKKKNDGISVWREGSIVGFWDDVVSEPYSDERLLVGA